MWSQCQSPWCQFDPEKSQQWTRRQVRASWWTKRSSKNINAGNSRGWADLTVGKLEICSVKSRVVAKPSLVITICSLEQQYNKSNWRLWPFKRRLKPEIKASIAAVYNFFTRAHSFHSVTRVSAKRPLQSYKDLFWHQWRSLHTSPGTTTKHNITLICILVKATMHKTTYCFDFECATRQRRLQPYCDRSECCRVVVRIQADVVSRATKHQWRNARVTSCVNRARN